MGRELFSCSTSEWRFLIELGRTFGWTPSGTTYELPAASKLNTPALRDYEPGELSDRKQVSTGDAIGWATALEAAIQASRSDLVIATRSVPTGRSESEVASFMQVLTREFIAYAYRGSFVFTLMPAQQTAQ